MTIMKFGYRTMIRLVVGSLFCAGLAVFQLSISASAASTKLCIGYAGCNAAGYSDSGYGTNNAKRYWLMYEGHNCTNYAAYRLVQNGMPNTRPVGDNGTVPGSLTAFEWGPAYASKTNATPAVGSIAWYSNTNPYSQTSQGNAGHVAYVERVNPDGSIDVSEDNWGGDFNWRHITPGAGWPSGFIHFKDVGPGQGSMNGYQVAFQANTGNLWTVGVGGGSNSPGDWKLGMAAGTSPSLAAVGSGGYVVAFQANTGNLWVVGPGAPGDTGLGMAEGTSPSVTALSGGGYQVAFQANTGSLWTTGSAGSKDWALGMAAGTSPSITGLSAGGFEVAFQANTSHLWTVGAGAGADMRNWEAGMAEGTSPAITGLAAGGYEVAFQANTGNLWTLGAGAGSEPHGDWKLGMKQWTSPSITGLASGGYQVAFQANTGQLCTVGAGGGAEMRQWDLGLADATSPAIVGLPAGGYEVAFQANTGSLWSVGVGAGAELHGDWQLGLAAMTSPCITSGRFASCPPASPTLQNTSAPSIQGTLSVGSLLTATPGSWRFAPHAFTYEWRRNETPIAGATGSTYRLQAADVGSKISVKVTATRPGFRTGSAVTTVGPIPAPAPAPTTAPSSTPAPTASPSPAPVPATSAPDPAGTAGSTPDPTQAPATTDAPVPMPTDTALPAPAKPKLGVRVTAVQRSSKLRIDVNPDWSSGNYTLQIQKKRGSKWATVKRTTTTGPRDIKTLDLRNGYYRVVATRTGYQTTTSQTIYILW